MSDRDGLRDALPLLRGRGYVLGPRPLALAAPAESVVNARISIQLSFLFGICRSRYDSRLFHGSTLGEVDPRRILAARLHVNDATAGRSLTYDEVRRSERGGPDPGSRRAEEMDRCCKKPTPLAVCH